MFQSHKIVSVAIGALYAILLYRLSVPQPVFRVMLPVFLLFCLAASYYNKKYLHQINKYNFWVLVRSVLIFFSGFAIFFLLPTPVLRTLFLITAFLVISLAEVNLGNFAESLVINETLLIAFGLLLGFAAMGQYFPDFHQIALHLGRWHLLNWQFSLQPLYLLGIFLAIFLLSRAFYEFIPQRDKTKWVAATALSLFCAELFWAESFLPLHYSAQGLILLCLFYFCLILNYYHFFQTLTIKKVQFHLMLVALAIVIVVLATPWKILT